MGNRIINAIGWLLLEFEARMITFMIWLCWICGITADDVERVRGQRKSSVGDASMTNNPEVPPEPGPLDPSPLNPRQRSSTSRRTDHGS